ncbi:MAG: hypothetical protein HFH08_06795 [Bacilli bacterium]|nr:hypothetical protein [Bacilli bacterium]
MEKKLPKVFANKIEKEIQNNDRVYVASRNIEEKPNNDMNFYGMNVNQKIKAILNSKNYVYKAEVEITTHNGTITKKVIGKNGNQLITMDNELIPIDTILDIQLKAPR